MMMYESVKFSGYAQPSPLVTYDLMAYRLEALKRMAEKLTGEIRVLGQVKLATTDCGVDYYEEVKAFEIALIRRALYLSKGKQASAARLLGLRKTTLNQIIKRYEIRLSNE